MNRTDELGEICDRSAATGREWKGVEAKEPYRAPQSALRRRRFQLALGAMGSLAVGLLIMFLLATKTSAREWFMLAVVAPFIIASVVLRAKFKNTF